MTTRGARVLDVQLTGYNVEVQMAVSEGLGALGTDGLIKLDSIEADRGSGLGAQLGQG
jgi:hypothetical protein